MALAIALGGIDEITTEVQRLVQGADGVVIVLLAPAGGAQGPGPEADFRYLPSQSPECSIVHVRLAGSLTDPAKRQPAEHK
jgi:hypothetical protein